MTAFLNLAHGNRLALVVSRKRKRPTKAQKRQRAYCAKYARHNPRFKVVSNIVWKCKRLGIPCDRKLLMEIECPTMCPVLGTPISFERGNGRRPNELTASFDRIHPGTGYVPGNVVIKSMRANMMKGDATPDEEFLYAQHIMSEQAHRFAPC